VIGNSGVKQQLSLYSDRDQAEGNGLDQLIEGRGGDSCRRVVSLGEEFAEVLCF